MLGLSARSGALAAGLGVVVALLTPIGSLAYADGTTTTPDASTTAPAIDTPVAPVPATDVPATDVPVTPAPATDAPVTDLPATDVPALTPPLATVAPVGSAPVASAPVVAKRRSTAKPFHPLHVGSRGRSVLALERRVAMKHPDTYFGVDTKRRVQSIQRWGHLRRSGVVDARTSRVISKWIKVRHHHAQVAAHRMSVELARIIMVARHYRGRPYVYGAAGPRAFDCSGFTKFVVAKAIGRSLPRVAASQASHVRRVSRSHARPGDLVFFHGRGGVYHVGIYAGGNRLWHAARPGTRTGLGPIFSSDVTFGRVV